MPFLIDNVSFPVRVSLTLLQKCGLWQPSGLSTIEKILYNFYGFLVYMFMAGSFIIAQVVDLYFVWGNLPLMTADAFLLFTNVVHTIKIINLVYRQETIQSIITSADNALREAVGNDAKAIVRSCNTLTTGQMYTYFLVTLTTLTGWAGSTDARQLPLRAWYPYDSTISPAYELTYMHQTLALLFASTLNICKDNLVTGLIAHCRCRLQLLGLSLRTLCRDLRTDLLPLTIAQEKIVSLRLRRCVQQHQAVLVEVQRLQACFSLPTFIQFTVSLVIICVTAFQIVTQPANLIRLFSMGTYLLNMSLQVFIYCYHGTQLSEESSKIAGYAYESPWYLFPVRLRRKLLILMTRARRLASISAAGMTTLSLATFMAIIKASYSLFTLLQQVHEKI